MKFLLDVNLLVALGYSKHEFHHAAARWLSTLDARADTLVTCSLTEIGFVRVLAQTPAYGLSLVDARYLLQRMKDTCPVAIELVADDQGVSHLPSWVHTPKQLSDGHLSALARAKGAQLVTMDRGIPGATLIPLHV